MSHMIYDCHVQLTSGEVIAEKSLPVKQGDVWQTCSGNLVYIVKNVENDELGFLWYDDVDGDLNLAALEDRLAIRTSHDLEYWMHNARTYTPVFIKTREIEKD